MKGKHVLVVGGGSGLGLEIARLCCKDGASVSLTSRDFPGDLGFPYDYHWFEASRWIERGCPSFCGGHIDAVVYAAGYFQEGCIDDLTPTQIQEMNNVGLIAPEIILRQVMRRQGELEGFIPITSTSQWTPRLKEPVYNGVKAGLAMFAKAVSLDERVGKVLVAAPAGMKTAFWRDGFTPEGELLDPAWVAEQVMEQYDLTDRYREVRILREPARVEVVEPKAESS